MAYRVLLALALACFAVPALAQESQLDVVLKRDKLIVGTYSTSPPLAYVDDKGELVGFEIDLAHETRQRSAGRSEKGGVRRAAVRRAVPVRAVRQDRLRPVLHHDHRRSRRAYCLHAALYRHRQQRDRAQGCRDQDDPGAQQCQVHLRDPERPAGDRARQAGAAECQAVASGQPLGTVPRGQDRPRHGIQYRQADRGFLRT